jgi:CBS domain containing-hemolysin-like protein
VRRTLDNLVGVARAQRILRDVMEKQEIGRKTCEDQPVIVHDRMNALQLLERFRRERNHFAVVVDEFGSVLGVVTPADVLEAIAGMPPEAGDEPLAGEKQADGTWVFDGAVELRQVCQALSASLPESVTYATIAGYLLTEFGRLPQMGDTLDRLGLRFEIAGIEGQRIAKVRVLKLSGAVGERVPESRPV